MEAEDVTVEKSAKTGAKEHTYGVFVSSANSTAKLKDVTVENAKTAGIGTTGGTVTANNVTVTGGAAGIETKAGTMLKATDATTGITINGTAYGIKNMSGTTTLKNVVVNNTTTAGVYMEKGTLNTENVTVSGGPVGIETKAGTVDGVLVENITQAGIKKESDTSTVKNVTITNEKKSGIVGVQMTDGTLFLDTIHVTGGNKGIHITGGTLGAEDAPIQSVTITGTNAHAVHIQNATVYADDFDISNVTVSNQKGIVVQGGTAVVTNSTISNINNSAVYIAKSNTMEADVTLEGVNITQCGAYGIQMDSANNIATTVNSVTIDKAASGITFAGGTLTIDDFAITGTAKSVHVNGATTLAGKVNFVPTSYAEDTAIVTKKDSVSEDVLAAVSALVEIAPDANGDAWFVNSSGLLTKAYAKVGDVFYTSFADAMSNAVENDTITLYENVAVSETITIDKNLTFTSNKAVEIVGDVNGAHLFNVLSGKTFHITGASETAKITVKKDATNNVINNSGTTQLMNVVIDGGRLGINNAKTLLIKEILDENIPVSLFTRPRRFGKTLNMDMLRVFFENTENDTSVYFMDKKIWRCGEKYREHQGKYPVIFLTFKDVKFMTWEDNISYLKFIFATEFNRHPELFESDKCNAFEKKYFARVASGEASEMDLTQALLYLTQMLDKHHKVAPIVIIDEYDSPIQQGYMKGYYEQAVTFVRSLFSGGFKDNTHLSYGFMTGILRVARESIFSGLNNIKVNSILEDDYSEYFGFTPEEVREMAQCYGVMEKYDEICKWYDGYRFGESHIYNPWSVIGYFNSKCTPKPFWVSTSNNDIVGEILENATDEIFENLYLLLQGKSISTTADTNVIYPNIKKNPDAVFSFLLVAGYLKIAGIIKMREGENAYEVAIPNLEIYTIYRKEILSKLSNFIPDSTGKAIQKAICDNNVGDLQKQLQKLLLETVSYNDAANESFYHGFMLGLCALMDGAFYVSSNRETGEGRFDIQLMPKKNGFPGVLIELKSGKQCPPEQLVCLAEDALNQIELRHYDTEMKRQGVSDVVKYGVAFCGKKVEIVMDSAHI